MAALAWLLVPLLTPGAVMGATLALQRWEDVVLPSGRAVPAPADLIVDQDAGDGLSELPRRAQQVTIPKPRL